jgi:DNA-binding transcriptional LysR family regulator
MNFTFHQLKVFIVVVEKKSITKAAIYLNMTQPAVSIQLKNLQNQFDSSLTEVIGRKLYITDFGLELYSISQNILREVETINYRTQNFKGLLSGKLKISVVSTGKYIMPYFLKSFINAHPKIDLEMEVTNRNKVLEGVENNTVDFSLVSILPKDREVGKEILMPNKLFLTVPGDYQAVSKEVGESIESSIMGTLPLIFREPGSATRHKMQEYFKESHILPRIKLELTSNEAVKQAVIAGLGGSILSLLSIKNELKTGEIKILPLKGFPIHSEWALIWPIKKQFSWVASAYLEYVRGHKTQIYNQYFRWIEEYS